MQIAFSRYGSSAFSRRYRSSTSGRAARSASSDRSNDGETSTSRVDTARSWRSSSTTSMASRMRMVVLEADHVEGDLGSHVRVAVTVAADPGAERQRPGDRRQVDPETPQRPVELIEHVGNGAPVELVEVVDGIAGLVDRLGPGDAEIVGQPEQVDDLGQLAVGSGISIKLQQIGDSPQPGQRRPPGRLGRVGGEDRPHRQPGRLVGHLPPVDARRLDGIGDPCQPSPLLPDGPQGPDRDAPARPRWPDGSRQGRPAPIRWLSRRRRRPASPRWRPARRGCRSGPARPDREARPPPDGSRSPPAFPRPCGCRREGQGHRRWARPSSGGLLRTGRRGFGAAGTGRTATPRLRATRTPRERPATGPGWSRGTRAGVGRVRRRSARVAVGRSSTADAAGSDDARPGDDPLRRRRTQGGR